MGNSRPEYRFSVAMRELRERSGQSQVAVAKGSGISDPLVILRMERIALNPAERRRIRLDEAVAIADHFGVSIPDMLAMADTQAARQIAALRAELARLEGELTRLEGDS